MGWNHWVLNDSRKGYKFFLTTVQGYAKLIPDVKKPTMKPKVNTQTVQSSGITSSVKFGIKASGLHHILGILRNQLYSDKVLAVIREYTCNAVDAHVEAHCPTRPIVVTLPNRMNPYFKVRDFGLALSDQDIHEIYAFYGESTKRNTNDQIGMLGIGSKAAFAYGDNFVINSYLDGKKSSYNAFIDPTQVGQISKLSEMDTKEENGIEIVVPIKDEDSDEFVKKAKDLFEWFSVRPTIKGAAQFEYNDEKTLFNGEYWRWTDCNKTNYDRNNEAIVVMGNIGYPIDEYSLNLTQDDDFRSLLTDNLILEVEIGDVEISASREKLQYTDYTRAQLKKYLKGVQKELSETIGKQFGECKTLYDARCLYGSTFRTDSPLYALRNVLHNHLTFKGEKVDGSSFQTYNTGGVDLRHFKKTYRSEKWRPEETQTISCEKDTVIIENDIGHRRGLMGRMLPLILTKGKKPFLLQFNPYSGTEGGKNVNRSASQVKKAWLKAEKFDGETIKLSELPQHKLSEFGYGQTSGGGSSYTKDAKHSAKCFEFDFKADIRRYHSKKSDHWKIAELDVENEDGVYVIIDKFHIERKDKNDYTLLDDPSTIRSLKEVIEQMGVKFPKNLYAFKVGQRGKIENKDGWVELHEWAKGQLETVIAEGNLHQAWIDIQKVDDLNNWNDGDRYYGSRVESQISCFKKLELVAPDGVMASFLAKHNEMKKDKKIHEQIKAIQAIAREYHVDFTCPKGVKPTHEIKKLYMEVLKKYDMIPLVERGVWGYEWTTSQGKVLSNYINVIDVCNASQGGSEE
ncbi:hypothetical protein CMI37_34995 [Candidatus Pacearchaeota archaeon]|nr:hypothetical protein [Candidatus Pacearchaeota archaeon]|tara:strand:+ start:841 stop:3228 length:2388 start_codon:yes stop_codon:yes gene_type:complete